MTDINTIRNVDWVEFLKRKRILFEYYAFMDLEKDLLLKTTGFSYKHHLYTYEEGVGTHFRSAEELDKSNSFYADLIKKDDKQLEEWRNKGLEFNKKADEFVKKFENLSQGEISGKEFRKYYEDLSNILMFGVTIPFLVLSAIDAEKEKGNTGKNFDKFQELFEPLRNIAKFPSLEKTMLKYFFELSGLHHASTATPEELTNYFEKGAKINEKELEKRASWCVFWEKDNKIIFSYDKKITEEIPILSQTKASRDIIKGNVAFPGIAQGKVKIINAPEDMEKFENGDILVSFATNPSLMPVILKAKAIVTNEGGIMCHAAIISRELKKPCIIATKIATKVLHDGDMVEVDANKGIVRKLNV